MPDNTIYVKNSALWNTVFNSDAGIYKYIGELPEGLYYESIKNYIVNRTNDVPLRNHTTGKLVYTHEVIEEMFSLTPGDINIDDILDAEDALEYLKIGARLSIISDDQIDTGLIDLNADGGIDSGDALAVLETIAGLKK